VLLSHCTWSKIWSIFLESSYVSHWHSSANMLHESRKTPAYKFNKKTKLSSIKSQELITWRSICFKKNFVFIFTFNYKNVTKLSFCFEISKYQCRKQRKMLSKNQDLHISVMFLHLSPQSCLKNSILAITIPTNRMRSSDSCL
jgi:hypothetical protein